MFICWNAEKVHGQRKIGNPCLKASPMQWNKFCKLCLPFKRSFFWGTQQVLQYCCDKQYFM